MTAWRAHTGSGRGSHAAVITTAAPGRSRDLTRRQRNYLIAMTLRLVCFIGMIVVPGPARFVLLFAALVLPGVAVLLANTVDRRRHRPGDIALDQPIHREALPQQSTDVLDGEVTESPSNGR